MGRPHWWVVLAALACCGPYPPRPRRPTAHAILASELARAAARTGVSPEPDRLPADPSSRTPPPTVSREALDSQGPSPRLRVYGSDPPATAPPSP